MEAHIAYTICKGEEEEEDEEQEGVTRPRTAVI